MLVIPNTAVWVSQPDTSNSRGKSKKVVEPQAVVSWVRTQLVATATACSATRRSQNVLNTLGTLSLIHSFSNRAVKPKLLTKWRAYWYPLHTVSNTWNKNTRGQHSFNIKRTNIQTYTYTVEASKYYIGTYCNWKEK